MYEVFFSTPAKREFKKLPTATRRWIREILLGTFSENPYSRAFDIKKLQPPLEGYRLRIGDYRILYEIEDKQILVYAVLHRKDAYK